MHQPRARTPAHKLLPPDPGPAFLPRAALEDRIRQASTKRLTTVVAGAGYGKSTLLATVARARGWAWYTVDRRDDTISSLALGFRDVFLARVPVLARRLGNDPLVASGGSDADERGRAEAFAEHVCEALQEGLSEDVVLVLDDVHEVGAEGASSRLIEALCRHAPSRLHIVLSSRSQPPFPVQRLRGRGQVLDITGPQLALSEEEAEELLVIAIGDGARGLAGMLQKVTGGWPAAVRLAIEALRDVPPGKRASMLEGFADPGSPVFEYLAEEVFFGEAPHVRRLLRYAARFELFTAGMLDSLGIERARPALLDLARRGLFVVPQEDGWFGLHALARGFVRERWPLGAEELRALHGRAAAWFVANDHAEEALRSLVASSDREATARFLVERGPALLASGGVESIIGASADLPAELRSEPIELLEGQARQTRGDWEGALACLERAGAQAGEIAPGIAWRKGLIHYLRGDLGRALEEYGRGRVDGTEPADEARLLAWNATAHWVRGDFDSAAELATRALDVATRAGKHQGLAAAHTVLAMLASSEGDRIGTAWHDLQALEHAEQGRDVLQMIRIRTNHASHLAAEGRYDEALGSLDKAIRMAEIAGFVNFLALGLTNRGDAKLRLGRLDEAIADLEAGRALYERLGSGALSYPLGHLGDLYRERGDLELARTCYEGAASLAESSGDVQGLVPALAGLARVLAAEDPGEADRVARRAISSGPGTGYVVALLSGGWLALTRGEPERAAELATRAAGEARERRDPAGLAESLALAAFSAEEPSRSGELLGDALAVYRDIGAALHATEVELALARLSAGPEAAGDAARIERRLRGLGVRHAAERAAGLLWALARRQVEPVRIQTLGGFALTRGGEAVPRSEWQSKKAQELLKVLLARQGRPTPRDLLMEVLWPEEDPDRLAHRLSVALATLRKVLDPDRRFESDHFVGGDAEALWLDSANVTVDVERFVAEARTGLALLREGRVPEAIDSLEAAESLYAGDFLEEDLYEEWATPIREKSRALYISLSHALAEHAVQGGDHDAAVRYLLRLLERDPFDEEAHLLLVATLDHAGRHGEARRRYRAYAARMEEIEVEAAPFLAQSTGFRKGF